MVLAVKAAEEGSSQSSGKRKHDPPAQTLKYQHARGIQDLCKVKRLSHCTFCNGELKKGSWKFSYAPKLNRPPMSIHTHCLQSMDREAAAHSLQVVQSLQAKYQVASEERLICADAATALQERLQTACAAGVSASSSGLRAEQ